MVIFTIAHCDGELDTQQVNPLCLFSGLLNGETMGINNTEVVFVLHLNNLSINWGRLEGQEVKEGPWWAKGRTAIGR